MEIWKKYLYSGLKITTCRRLLNFNVIFMKTKKFNGFNEKGYIPPGIYNMTLENVENIFSKNKSRRRKIIMATYKKHLTEIKNTGYYLDHWINGSFTTLKENPHDIDTLTELDGAKIDENKDKEKIEELFRNLETKTNHMCHSLKVYKYPNDEKDKYLYYFNTKRRILMELFATDRDGNPKGFIHLNNEENI